MARVLNIRSCSTSELHISLVVKLGCVHRRVQAGYFVDRQKRAHLNCTWSCIAYMYGQVSTEGDATTSVCVGTLTFSKCTYAAAWRSRRMKSSLSMLTYHDVTTTCIAARDGIKRRKNHPSKINPNFGVNHPSYSSYMY